ncbi:ATP synthase mitochondrial F1 complex assembly factor 2 [Chloropicon primus]|uniref:ATP synthase mitochondrial F1 complex assembly factor 2 n=1 Tax=Chloropicon primus TaxID=1764295 RepID=A0A5B8MVA2_9CHLO|nr:ATP synthase mitochondrial F1 complex assembly factor 2 [Chloropicon primus]UPR03923.1 ATP synthase mitochondrial F1 complex assembly factor 2 [Chloropicon primus]|eukprot:QDZ24718.1 ATP synthase mitochondrial F1 complex assembly factor 2 [Chloropicon primus]
MATTGDRGGGDGTISSLATSSVGRSDQGSTSPRFYKRATAAEAEEAKGKWCVKLDGRKLRTPSLKVLLLPNAALAHAIAVEWEYQSSSSIRAFTMPLMQLATTATDRTPQDRDNNVATLLRYVHSDPGLCWVDEPGTPLAKAHEEAWKPVLDWFNNDLGIKVVKNESFIPVDQSPESIEQLADHLKSLDDWEFTCLHVLSTAVKSLLLARAVLEDKVSIKEAVHLSRLEEEMQIEEWGMVEGGHDIDRADQNVRVAAPAVFMKLYKGV